ncbi:MAG TPA: hypothetical protein VG916_08180 [Gemmatimonadaceae bacterium]|nr:hypothetical protein [Gemmatimonadaceae bacterium]
MIRSARVPGVALAVTLVGLAASPISARLQQRATYDPSLWSALRYRMVGPTRGGRVTAVTGVPSEPRTFYMGGAGGGVWKTTDAGASWNNVTDGQIAVGTIGAIDVSLSNPDVVYAGTGSSKIRSNVSIGRGIYKSTDAGRRWAFVGLRDVGQIATVRVHPSNPDRGYVAALGNPFVPNVDRGVFRTTDGGKSWTKVLYVSDSSGAADLELQPGNPDVLFASIWHGQRKPWTIVSGAMEGGIYKSTDGGDHWAKLGGGLPTGLFGRSNVAISNAAPNRIYALIEAKPGGGLYRSDDAGATWHLVNGAQNLWTRPFYYTTLGVDPKNPDVVWIGDEGWYKSTDGGRTFRSSPVPHGDNHDVWINPNNPDIMIQSNDGGATVSLDGGRTWSTEDNQPTAEIYQVYLDNQYPVRLYGAQQDNTTLIVPANPTGAGYSEEWRVGPGCETGPIMPHPTNPDTVYGSCKGQFSRKSMKTGQEWQSWIGGESLYGNGGATLIYRFQRVSPMEISPFNPKVIYYGSQYLHRSLDEGVTWRKISPDLTAFPPGEPQEASGTPITRDATGEEVYSVVYAIRESPVKKGVIWTGANDGPFYVTVDDGKTWKNVTPKDLPPGGRVQNIEPSPFRAGTAYFAVYRYLLGDFQPYIYRTDDFGATWTRLTDGHNGIAIDEPTRVVREDPKRPHLLYAGTEFGMYLSFDDGAHWQSFQQNLPATPVTDIKFANDNNDMVLSTMGRSFWVMDNLTPLRELSDRVAAEQVHLFSPRAAVRGPAGGRGGRGGGVQYLPAGAQIDYYLASAPANDIRLDILDSANHVVRTFSSAATRPVREEAAPAADDEEGGGRGRGGPPARLPKAAGLNRFTWDLRYPGAWQSAAVPEGGGGPLAAPGGYSVRLTAGSTVATLPFRVVEDPRVRRDGVSTTTLRTLLAHNLRVRDLVSDVNRTVARVRAAQARLRGATGAAADTLAKLDAIAAQLITPSVRYSQPALQTHITYLYGMTNQADQPLPKDAADRYTTLRKRLDAIQLALTRLLGPAM